MKDLQIFILLFIGFLNTLSGQSSFIDSSYTWTEAQYLGHTGEIFSNKFRLGSDAIIHGNKSYYEIMFTDSIDSENWHSNGSQIRFDSNRVWKYGLPSEYLLLDFNLEINDVFTDNFGSQMIVVSIDSITLQNGTRRKRLTLDCNIDPVYWIEGIGSTSGLNVFYNQCSIDAGSQLLCVQKNDTLLYQNPLFTDCWYSTVSTSNSRIDNITVFPNPVDDNLEISDPDQMMSRFYLYTSVGQYLFDGSKYDIDFNGFPAGCYYLKIAGKDGKLLNKMIIKQ